MKTLSLIIHVAIGYTIFVDAANSSATKANSSATKANSSATKSPLLPPCAKDENKMNFETCQCRLVVSQFASKLDGRSDASTAQCIAAACTFVNDLLLDLSLFPAFPIGRSEVTSRVKGRRIKKRSCRVRHASDNPAAT